MDSRHLFSTFVLLVGLISASLIIAAGAACAGKLSDALVVLLNSVIMGSFALLRSPSPKNVTVDNAPSDPVPVEAS